MDSAVSGASRLHRLLYRAMKADETGRPQIGPRGLGVRVGHDVCPDSAGLVVPGGGGMSVTPDDPMELPIFCRPRSLGGTGKAPVWQLYAPDLPSTLQYRNDSRTHGLIEPTTPMPLAHFEHYLAETAAHWTVAHE